MYLRVLVVCIVVYTANTKPPGLNCDGVTEDDCKAFRGKITYFKGSKPSECRFHLPRGEDEIQVTDYKDEAVKLDFKESTEFLLTETPRAKFPVGGDNKAKCCVKKVLKQCQMEVALVGNCDNGDKRVVAVFRNADDQETKVTFDPIQGRVWCEQPDGSRYEEITPESPDRKGKYCGDSELAVYIERFEYKGRSIFRAQRYQCNSEYVSMWQDPDQNGTPKVALRTAVERETELEGMDQNAVLALTGQKDHYGNGGGVCGPLVKKVEPEPPQQQQAV